VMAPTKLPDRETLTLNLAVPPRTALWWPGATDTVKCDCLPDLIALAARRREAQRRRAPHRDRRDPHPSHIV